MSNEETVGLRRPLRELQGSAQEDTQLLNDCNIRSLTLDKLRCERRGRWAANIKFQIAFSPERLNSEGSARDAELDVSSGRKNLFSEDVLADAETPPRAPSMNEEVLAEQVSGERQEVVAQLLDEENPQHEFSFATFACEPGSSASALSPLAANSPLTTSATGSALGLSFSGSPTATGQKHEPASADSSVADASTGDATTMLGTDVNMGELSTTSGDVDFTGTPESTQLNISRQLWNSQRSGQGGPLVDESCSLPTSMTVTQGKQDLRTGVLETFIRLHPSPLCENTAAAPSSAQSISKRSKTWLEQRDQRLLRLRSMHWQIVRDGGTNKSTSGTLSASGSQLEPSGMDVNGTVGSKAGPETVYSRGEAWLERKRIREKALREIAFHDEVKECSFRPNTSEPSRAIPSVTPERARQLFDRQVSWKQRLDDHSECKRREKWEASEREIQAFRRSQSADAALRIRSSRQQCQKNKCVSAVADDVFNGFYERNQKWLRERDARIEQLQEEHIAQQVQAPGRQLYTVHSTAWRRRGSQSCEPPAISGTGGNIANAGAEESNAASEKQLAPLRTIAPCSEKRPLSSRPSLLGKAQASKSIAVHATPGLPVRAPPPASLPSFGQPEQDEVAEVMCHLQSLRRCLLPSQSRDAATWQRTVRVVAARLGGAGAAPVRAASLDTNTLTTDTPMRTARGRTRSPAMRRCSPSPRANAQVARSRDPSPNVVERARMRPCHTPRSPSPRVAREMETRQSNTSPAPVRPKSTSAIPRINTGCQLSSTLA